MDLQKETPGVRRQIGAYVKKSNRGYRTPMMVSVTAPSKMARPVDVVLVLHISIRCTTPSNWHGLLQEATKLVTEKLGDHDRLALVPALSKRVRTSTRTFTVPANPNLLLMTTENRTSVRNLVRSSESMRSDTPLTTLLETAESVSRRSKYNDKCNASVIQSN
jgi:hypothetical protein